jgi:hypothetical protein
VPLKTALDAMPKLSPIILVKRDGKPGPAREVPNRLEPRLQGCRPRWAHVPRSAVTRLAIAGATEAEIAIITGHSLRSVRAILDTHYLARDPSLAESAVAKLERRTNAPN